MGTAIARGFYVASRYEAGDGRVVSARVVPVGRSRVQRAAGRAGMGLLWAQIEKPAGLAGFIGLYFYLENWGK